MIILVNLNKLTKSEYCDYMISLINTELVKETWDEFKTKFKQQTGKNPEFWTEFMELDNADLSDLQILASVDKNFDTFVVSDPTILNDEVTKKIRKKVSGKIPDHIQIDIEGDTNSGKSTIMRTFMLDFFDNPSVDDIFYMKKDLLEYVAEHTEHAYKSVKCLDEDVVSRGTGSVRVEEDLTQLFESCRKAQLSYIGCHAIRKHENQTTYYRFICFAKNTERRLTACAVYRKNVCIGFILVRIPYSRKFFELEYDYEKKKDAFIQATMKNENIETIDIKKCALKVLEDKEMQILRKMNKLNKKSLKTKVYEMYNNYTIGEQEMIISKAFMIMLADELGENPDDVDNEILEEQKSKQDISTNPIDYKHNIDDENEETQ